MPTPPDPTTLRQRRGHPGHLGRRGADPRHDRPSRPVRPGLAGPVRAGGHPDPGHARRPGQAAGACRIDVGARALRQADHRHRPGRPGLRRTSPPTSPTWRRPATSSPSASRTGSSTGVFKGPDTNINLHTFSEGCPEIDKMLGFRDWLRTHDEDRDLYERTKQDLAAREWRYIQHYADAKTEVVEGIVARANAERHRRGMMSATTTRASRTGRTDAQPGPAEAAHRADRQRARRPPAVHGDLAVLPAPEPRRLGQALPRPVDRGSPARPADHGLPDRQRGRVRPAGPQGDVHPVRLGRRRPPSAPWSPSGPSPPSSTGWRPSRAANDDHRGHQFLQWFIEEQVEEEAKLQKIVDLIDSGINLFQAEALLGSFE